MSTLLKYLLLLIIFLLAGLGQLSAHTTSSKKEIQESKLSSLNNEASNKNEAFFIGRTSHKNKQSHIVDVLIESESENELVSFKKRLENSHYPIDVCFGQTTSRDHFCHAKTTLSNQHFSSDRCLLIRVFRI